MEIVIHGHQTNVTDSLRLRADEAARKLGEKLRRATSADIRFEEDGVLKAVEIVLFAPNNVRLVAKAEDKYHEAALTEAIAKVDSQIRKLKTSFKKKRIADA